MSIRQERGGTLKCAFSEGIKNWLFITFVYNLSELSYFWRRRKIKIKIEEIREKIRFEEYKLTFHAIIQADARQVSHEDIKEAIFNGEIIEEKHPHYLICGERFNGDPIHIALIFKKTLKIITVYYPDEGKWIKNKIRRRRKKRWEILVVFVIFH